MKKIIILLLILIPLVHGIGLSTPSQSDYLFEPNKHMVLDYGAGNTNIRPTTVVVKVDAGELSDYLEEMYSVEVPARSSAKLRIEFDLPSQLARGAYPISLIFSEKPRGGGMSASSGVHTGIKIINMFDEAHPYMNLVVDPRQSMEGAIKAKVHVQNIGKTAFNRVQAQFNLVLNGDVVRETVLSVPALRSLGTAKVIAEIDKEGLMPGEYTLEVKIKGETVSQIIVIGAPILTVLDFPKIEASKENEIEFTLLIDEWETEIKDIHTHLSVIGLFGETKTTTLKQGQNKLTFKAKAAPAAGGVYQGRVRIRSLLVNAETTFDVDVEGSKIVTGGGGFGFAGPGKAAETQAPAQPEQTTEMLPPPSKNNTFLIVLLALSIMVFAFAIGMYMGRGRKHEETEAPLPKP